MAVVGEISNVVVKMPEILQQRQYDSQVSRFGQAAADREARRVREYYYDQKKPAGFRGARELAGAAGVGALGLSFI